LYSVPEIAYFFFLLCLAVFAVNWLARHSWCRYLGSALLALLVGAVMANLGVLVAPSAAKPLYDSTLAYVGPLSVFYLALQVNLRDLKHTGAPMLLAFAIAGPSIFLGAWLGYTIFLSAADSGTDSAVLAGMLIAGHIGGSANFNAIAIHYEVLDQATVFATVLAVDHVVIALWIGITAVVPRLLRRAANSADTRHATQRSSGSAMPGGPVPELTVGGLGLFLAAGLGCLWFSHLISSSAAPLGFTIPVILMITVFALAIGQLQSFRRIAGYKPFGDFLVLLFLLLVGAHSDFAAMLDYQQLASLTAGMLGTCLLVHGVALVAIGRLFRLDWDVLAVGSQASFGGPVSAAALAETLDRSDLVVPAVLAGSLGGALGTFVGFAAVVFLA
jgi:uncharacterized membrane protein